MEEIDIKELFSFFKSKLKIIIIVTVLVLYVGMCYSVIIKKPLYDAETTVILVNKADSGLSASNTQVEVSLNQKLVETYTQIVKSKTVLKEVKSALGLEYSIDQLYSMISVSGVGNTEIIKINVRSDNNAEAASIANKVAEQFKKRVVNIYNLENVTVLDSATVPTNPSNINIIKDIIIYFLVGFVLSCGIVFMFYYFDNTVKSKEQIEKKLGISVIGNIPYVRKK